MSKYSPEQMDLLRKLRCVCEGELEVMTDSSDFVEHVEMRQTVMYSCVECRRVFDYTFVLGKVEELSSYGLEREEVARGSGE